MNSHTHGRDCATCPSRMEGVFCDLSPDLVQQLNGTKTTNTYKKGQFLFYQGNEPKGLFCAYSGKIKVYKSGSEGNDTVFRIAGAGDVLGYRSILTDEPYNVTAEVIEDAEVCFIDRLFFQELIKKNAGLAFNIIRKLGTDLDRVEVQLSDVLNKTVRQRLAKLLLTMQKTYGKKEGQGTLLDIRLTREEIASMIGATPETIIRLLSDFKDLGFVRLDGKKIIIQKPEELFSETDLQN